MQVEHKTEKGNIVFVKIPDNAKAWKNESYHVNTLWYKSEDMRNPKYIELPYDDLGLIGLTSEVTEEQCQKIIEFGDMYPNEDMFHLGFPDYENFQKSDSLRYVFDNALDSLKSLMQHLKIYEVNPFKINNCKCDILKNSIYEFRLCAKNHINFKEAESRAGKWIVLFKPNEK